MIYRIYRTEEEIDDLLNDVTEQQDAGSSKYPGMTYEEGIAAAIDWLTAPTVEEGPLD